jgi:predicted nucleotidyltransferase
LARALRDPLAPEARELAAQVADAFGASTMAVVHYGSRAQGRWTRRESAFDFFVVVRRYADAYRSLAAAGRLPRAPWVASGLARVLPPI